MHADGKTDDLKIEIPGRSRRLGNEHERSPVVRRFPRRIDSGNAANYTLSSGARGYDALRSGAT